MNPVEMEQSCQYLTFSLNRETFAVAVAGVKEILDLPPLTKVPQMPPFLAGVINLRGRVVPVVDLRLKFGMPPAERTRETCVVVLEIEQEGELIEMGALVDGVKEVLPLHPEQIEPPPRLGLGLQADFLRGMGKTADGFLLILNTDQVFSGSEVLQVQSALAQIAV